MTAGSLWMHTVACAPLTAAVGVVRWSVWARPFTLVQDHLYQLSVSASHTDTHPYYWWVATCKCEQPTKETHSKNRLFWQLSVQCVALPPTFSLCGNGSSRQLILSSGVFIKLLRKDKLQQERKMYKFNYRRLSLGFFSRQASGL